jgi:GPI mannosyltransferase 3
MVRERTLHLTFLFGLLVLAVVSENPFHLDEHFQIMEFAAFKAGRTPSAWLPWEYGAEMRPWLMPSVAYLAMRALAVLGSTDPFVVALLLRGFAAVLGAIATFRILDHSDHSLFFARDDRAKLAHAAQFFVLTAAFTPYLAVRFSSESISGALFVIGFCELESHTRTRTSEALAAACLALSVHCRYQTGLMVLGYALWRMRYARFSVREASRLTVGFTCGIALGCALDAWGYGHLALPFFTYVRMNVVEGVAAAFSTEPPYAYAYLPLTNLFTISATLALVGSLVFWVRFPGHVYTWLMAPSLIGFSLLGHKEERFLFPLALLAASCVVPAFGISLAPSSRFAARFERFTSKVWAARNHTAARVLWGVNVACLGLACIYPVQWREHIPLVKYMYRNLSSSDIVWIHESDTTRFPLFRGNFEERTYKTECELRRGDYILTAGPPPPDAINATRVYQEWPLPAQTLRTVAESARNTARRLFGPVILPIAWMSLYQVRTAREGKRCEARVFEPIATEPPQAKPDHLPRK